VHWTFYIGVVGDYFLETQHADWNSRCGSFNVKMWCSNGAEAASPADSDPLGFSVDVKTGAITGTPQRVRDGYKMRLRAVDAADVRTDVKEWAFDVKEPPKFALNPDANWTDATDGNLASKYHVGETHLLPKPRIKKEDLLQHPAGGNFGQVVYLLSAQPVGAAFGPTLASPSNCTATETDASQIVSALTDVATGAGAINIQCEGSYEAKLVVRDGAGDEVVLRSWRFEVLRRDTAVPEHGPGGQGCANGSPVDGAEMDRKFTCDCSATKFSGDNCMYSEAEVKAAQSTSSQDATLSYAVVGVVFGVLVLAAVIVKYQRYQRSRMATDFLAQLTQMKDQGQVGADLISRDRVPRELKRGWLTFINKLGEGAFGEVWKGLLKDGNNVSVPEYIVAAKTIKEGKAMEASVFL